MSTHRANSFNLNRICHNVNANTLQMVKYLIDHTSAFLCKYDAGVNIQF